MRLAVRISILFLLTITNEATADMISCRSSEELKADARVVVVAIILTAKLDGISFRGKSYAYTVRIDAPEKGAVIEKELVVTYEDVAVHKRGDQIVYPSKHGSGIERDLTVGGRYRLFLRSAEDPEILLAEKVTDDGRDGSK